MQTDSLEQKKEVNSANEEIPMRNSFLGKLYIILSNQALSEVISWTEGGEIFRILDSEKLQDEVIPAYFKHRNFKSFIRQLNLHGFKKLRGRAKSKDNGRDLYKHNFFRRDQPDLISYIKRKVSKPSEIDEKTKQINSLIETQKDLQEKVKKIFEAKNSEAYKVLSESAADEPTKLFMEALNILGDGREPPAEVVPAATIYSLTQIFLANLSMLKMEIMHSEDCTAASLNLDSEDLHLLAKRGPIQDWDDDIDTDYGEIPVTPRKSLKTGSCTPCLSESDQDFDRKIQCRMNTKPMLSKPKTPSHSKQN